MPPRTGPRRKRRPKQAVLPARHFTVIRGEAATGRIVTEVVIAHSLELEDHNLVFRDASGAISQVFARDGWLQVRPAIMADIPYPEEADNAPGSGADDERIDGMQREEATLTPPTREEVDQQPAYPATNSGTNSGPFVPSSPEEAQRILRELERRVAPDYQDPSDCESNAPPAAPPRPKD